MPFQIRALAAEPFAPLFALSADELRARGAVRQTADRTPGFPCRVSLADAEPVLDRMFARDGVAYLHLHNAKPGCYAARVDRV